MIRYALHLIPAVLLMSAAVADSIGQSSWRPFSNPAMIVTVGMSKGEVLLKAGPPDLAETLSHGVAGSLSQVAWTYVKRGHNAAVAVLTFSGNKLVSIEVTLLKM